MSHRPIVCLVCSLLALLVESGAFAFVAVQSPHKNINEYGEPEYGHALTEKEAMDGWISLFDGKTTFGWKNAKAADGQLVSGTTTTSFFGKWWVKSDLLQLGELEIGKYSTYGEAYLNALGPRDLNGPISLKSGALKSLKLKPASLQPAFNGTDLTGWQRVDHPKLGPERRPKWEVKDGFVHAQGGPGALEYTKQAFGDGVLQLEIRTRARNSNGGLFFRCVPGQMMNGYEAQIYNRCEQADVSKPSVWATGAIDDRQNARRLVSRDGVPFVMTVIADGPHIATWVNGYQQVDWIDARPKNDNPRKGLRLEAGPIQLQAHDAATDIEFRSIRMATWHK